MLKFRGEKLKRQGLVITLDRLTVKITKHSKRKHNNEQHVFTVNFRAHTVTLNRHICLVVCYANSREIVSTRWHLYTIISTSNTHVKTNSMPVTANLAPCPTTWCC